MSLDENDRAFLSAQSEFTSWTAGLALGLGALPWALLDGPEKGASNKPIITTSLWVALIFVLLTVLTALWAKLAISGSLKLGTKPTNGFSNVTIPFAASVVCGAIALISMICYLLSRLT